jgi:hypothetical protein
MTAQQQLPPPAQMMQTITGVWTSCCIYNAAKLNVAEILVAKPLSIAQLAEATHSHAPSLYRLMRALASVGIFAENENGEFANTPLSETLRGDVPGSMKAVAIMLLGDHYGPWGNLLYSIKTGGIAFDNFEGMSLWQYYETHPDEGANFMKAMTNLSNMDIVNLLPAYNFSPYKTIVDIGGGNGALLMTILKETPGASGIVFDLEYVVEETEKLINAQGLGERCKTGGGDFFEAVPEGADAYILKRVLHDWDDEKALQILKNCAKAMKPGSKVLVLEAVISEGNTPHPGKFMDMNMMAVAGGRERTEKEWGTLFTKAGLKLNTVIHTHSPMLSVIEAVKG